MAARDSVSVPGFDTAGWCATLAGTLDAILSPDISAETALKLARETMRSYDAAIERALAAHARADNVIPIRPFSMHDILDEVFPK